MAKFTLLTTLALEAAGYEQGIDRAKTKTQTLQTTVQGVGSSIMKIAAPIATATGLLATFKAGVESSEMASDKLEETTGYLKGAFAGLFETIFTGNWQDLITNINNTAKATRNLARANDELLNITASNTIKLGYYRQELEQARLAAAGTTDASEKQGYIQAAIDAQKAITSIEIDEIRKRLQATENYFRDKKDWTEEEAAFNIKQIRQIAGNYEYYFGENSVAIEAMQQRISNLQYKSISTLNGLTKAEEKELRQTKLLIGSLEIYQDLMNGMKPDEFNAYVKTIGEYNTAVAEGDAALVKLTKQLTTVNEKLDTTDEAAKKAAAELKKLKEANNDNPITKVAIPSLNQTPNTLAPAPAKAYKDDWTDALTTIGNVANDTAAAFSRLGDAIANASEDGKITFAESMNVIMQTALAAIGVLGSLAAAQMISKEASKGLIGVFTAIAGLAALGGLWSTWVKGDKMKNMANGGIVYGESIVRVAEYGNAGSNPEVIAPLDKLQSLVGGPGEVTFKFQDGALQGKLNYDNRMKRSYR